MEWVSGHSHFVIILKLFPGLRFQNQETMKTWMTANKLSEHHKRITFFCFIINKFILACNYDLKRQYYITFRVNCIFYDNIYWILLQSGCYVTDQITYKQTQTILLLTGEYIHLSRTFCLYANTFLYNTDIEKDRWKLNKIL